MPCGILRGPLPRNTVGPPPYTTKGPNPMAQRVQVLLVCDVHDDDTTPGTETIPFAIDGTSYEIDVCDEHGAELRDALATFVAAARRTGGSRSPRRSASSTGRSSSRAAAGS